ncbi:MAG: hypothetical protein AAGF12_39830 [Myxococcota bacterium]
MRIVLVLLLIVVGAPATASASPWTLPEGDIVVAGSFDYQFATREYLDDAGDVQVFPLRGEYAASTYFLGVRAGFTDRLELELGFPIRLISYRSDPVLLLPQPGDSPLSAYDYYQENVVDLSRAKVGVGDILIAARYQLVRGSPFVMALELRAEAPTGYEAPAGTFGDDPESAQEFLSDVGRFVSPDNVTDDVTLGDGVLNLQPGILMGVAFSTRTFARLDLAYRLRFPSAGDQIFAGAKVGQFVLPWLLVFAEGRFAYAIEDGGRIGVSVAAIDPTLPAQDYNGVENLNLREVTLDRDALDVGGGILFRLTDTVETVVGFSRTIWGRNTAEINTVYVGMALRTDVRDDPPPVEELEEVYEEEVYEEDIYEEDVPDNAVRGTDNAVPGTDNAVPGTDNAVPGNAVPPEATDVSPRNVPVADE